MSSQTQEVQAETVIRTLRQALDEANFQLAVARAQLLDAQTGTEKQE